MQIQLSWIDPNTGEQREPLLETPVAIGREFAQMPPESNGERVSRIVIQDGLIAAYHALISWRNQQLIIVDQNTTNGIKINGVQLPSGSLRDGDRIAIGSCEILLNFTTSTTWECDRMVGFLFKRRCGRTDTINCQYCNYSNHEPSYYYEYSYYDGYCNYNSGWGSNYYRNRDNYCYDPETGNVDFTEADSISLESEGDGDFETDMGAS